MAEKKGKTYPSVWRIPPTLWAKLNKRKKHGQTLSGVVEDLLEEIDIVREKRDPLIDKIVKLQNDLDYFEQQNITPELLEKLEKRRHPYQSIGGVIIELLETAEKVKSGDFHLYNKPQGEG